MGAVGGVAALLVLAIVWRLLRRRAPTPQKSAQSGHSKAMDEGLPTEADHEEEADEKSSPPTSRHTKLRRSFSRRGTETAAANERSISRSAAANERSISTRAVRFAAAAAEESSIRRERSLRAAVQRSVGADDVASRRSHLGDHGELGEESLSVSRPHSLLEKSLSMRSQRRLLGEEDAPEGGDRSAALIEASLTSRSQRRLMGDKDAPPARRRVRGDKEHLGASLEAKVSSNHMRPDVATSSAEPCVFSGRSKQLAELEQLAAELSTTPSHAARQQQPQRRFVEPAVLPAPVCAPRGSAPAGAGAQLPPAVLPPPSCELLGDALRRPSVAEAIGVRVAAAQPTPTRRASQVERDEDEDDSAEPPVYLALAKRKNSSAHVLSTRARGASFRISI
jgi:hypothetical protein